MNIEEFREYCLSKKGVTEETPFGPDTLVYKVMGKIFALTSLDTEVFRINLKNLPEKNVELRANFDFVEAGYHMNKQHWNTVYIDFRLKTNQLKEWIDESYQIVADSLTKKQKEALKELS